MTVSVHIDLGYEFEVKVEDHGPQGPVHPAGARDRGHGGRPRARAHEAGRRAVVASEFEKLVEQYIANLVKAFGGEA